MTNSAQAPAATSPGNTRHDDVLFWIGVGLWLLVLAFTWPKALSFADEVGYLGQTKLLLDGHIRHLANSPGVWNAGVHGLVNKYPILYSALIAPVVALSPRAVFALSCLAAIALAWLGSRVLRDWGKSPLWALLVLAHPTVVILARTAMPDLLQVAALVGAWWGLRRGRAALTIAMLWLLVATKVTGSLLGFGVVVGEALRDWRALRSREPAALRKLMIAATGFCAGFATMMGSNILTIGGLWFAYDHRMLGTPPFWYTYLPERTPVHLRTLFINPPLLIAGVLPFWRARDFGALLIIVGYLALMCVYFFVDTGASWIESLVLSPRLILPVVAFLLIGYGAWLHDLFGWLTTRGVGRAIVRGGLLLVPAAVAVVVSLPHLRVQEKPFRTLQVAATLADARGGGTLGLTENACKVGLLYGGRTVLVDAGESRPAVVLCSDVSASHRDQSGSYSCALPGYRQLPGDGAFHVLVSDSGGE